MAAFFPAIFYADLINGMTMKNKSIFLTSLSVAAVLTAAFFVASESNAKQTRSTQTSNATTVIEYAQLTETNGVYVWQAGDTTVRPQNRSLRALYRELGGSRQDTLVNLLNRIGASGWELVESSQSDESITRVFIRR
ncbi:MAG: hypothetical protein AB8B55_24535 [Mariniblastus sp.]